jgi:hypothetical protein
VSSASPQRDPNCRPWAFGERLIADPATPSLRLDGPLVVASGGRAVRPVLLTNHTDTSVTIVTGRQTIAHIIDSDDETVGSYIGSMQVTIPLYVHRDRTAQELISPPLDLTISAPEETAG